MNVLFAKTAWEEYQYWQQKDKKIVDRINELIKSIDRDGFNKGIGKPEPLKYQYQGTWSRRISKEHRIIYSITAENIIIYSCKDHY